MVLPDGWLLAGGAIVVLLLVLLVYRIRARRTGLERVLDEIGFERVSGLVLPNADEGEIQIDHLILTARGLLVLHIKDTPGKVFGSDKMQDWTVIAEDRRYTFANPQPALHDRVAAVRNVVRDVPVSGRVCFLDGAEFTKGVPSMVATIAELRAEFLEQDPAAAARTVESFRPHWERLTRADVS